MNLNDEISVEQIIEAFYQYIVNDRLDIGINMHEALAALNKLREKDMMAIIKTIAPWNGLPAELESFNKLKAAQSETMNQRLSGGKE
jgi:hypothetical protein